MGGLFRNRRADSEGMWKGKDMDELKLNSKEAIFDMWAPKSNVWSPWVKPVLFACMTSEPESPTKQSINLDWVKKGDLSTAYVLDLPGAKGIWTGLDLVELGYRPVPLYNALPGPIGYFYSPSDEGPIVSQVNMKEIMASLWHGSLKIKEGKFASNAPPVFILDWNRRSGTEDVESGDFDNRSISFPTDFPSANVLLSKKISRVVVVQESGDQPQEDLVQTLRRWQDSGIKIELKLVSDTGAPRPIQVRKPPLIKVFWLHALALFGKGMNPHGGFGKIIGEGAGG
jgi:hypothetical protein